MENQSTGNMKNAARASDAIRRFEAALRSCMQRGFYGTLNFSVKFEDGNIQPDVDETVVRKHKISAP